MLFRRTKAGVEQVTDPNEMQRLLANPSAKGRPEQWYLESRRPDAQLMKELRASDDGDRSRLAQAPMALFDRGQPGRAGRSAAPALDDLDVRGQRGRESTSVDVGQRRCGGPP